MRNIGQFIPLVILGYIDKREQLESELPLGYYMKKYNEPISFTFNGNFVFFTLQYCREFMKTVLIPR